MITTQRLNLTGVVLKISETEKLRTGNCRMLTDVHGHFSPVPSLKVNEMTNRGWVSVRNPIASLNVTKCLFTFVYVKKK